MSYQTDILLETGTNELEIIEFYVEYPDENGKMTSQAFGINVAKVREIIRVPEITTLPKLPRGMLGIINLRDQLTPVLDLAQWLFNYEQPLERKKLIISKFNSVQV
ncbi:MAG: chemotaxis protein CheW, partial [Calditrichaeota bacterium]|nr:chemotaxis protein CheW [Calditrichota bacterium]